MTDEAHGVTWFAPDRPTGGTAYVRQDAEQPRVWLAGDIVPEDVAVLAPNSFIIRPNAKPYRAATPLVEMLDVPAFGELVAAERERRAAEGSGEG